MQTNPQSSATALALQLAAILFAGGLGAFFKVLWDRKKIIPEIDGIQAKAALDRATARHLDAETVNAAYDRIDELTTIISELRIENQELNGVRKANEILTLWNERMVAILKKEGLRVPSKWEASASE
jgi:tRNA A37 N6-isopentenylltransferase MiaA